MSPQLKLSRAEILILLNWSFFIEQGDIHANSGTSTITDKDKDFFSKLKKVYAKLKTHEKITKSVGKHSITYEESELALEWYKLLPESLIDKKDTDLHTTLSVFIFDNI